MVAVDGHVHFHDNFDLERFLDNAAANFDRAGREAAGVLMLAECGGVSRFDEWRSGGAGAGSWSFVRTAEENSLEARHGDGRSLSVVAGRQLVTAERLEVLALGTREQLPEGRDLWSTLEDVRRARGLPVLPWGVGKWTGRRGALVAEAIGRDDGLLLFAGDNGGRWRGLPRPALLGRAEVAGLPVLPGSDPLPFPGEEERVGAFGFTLEGTLEPGEPARWVLGSLLARPKVRPYGRGTPLIRFLRLQLAMQLRRRRHPSAR